MSKRVAIFMFVVTAVFALSLIVEAQEIAPPPPPPPPPHMGAGGMMVPHAPKVVLMTVVQKYFGLTDAQLQQWKDIQADKERQLDNLGQQIRGLEQQLEQQLQSANPAAEAVGSLVIQIRELRGQHGTIFATTADAFKATLTPEQAQKLEDAVKAAELRPVVDALVGSWLIPPPPPPPPMPHAAGTIPHNSGAPKVMKHSR